MKTQRAILLLGGNQGNVRGTFLASMVQLERFVGRVRSVSGLYSTQAWGPVAQDDFLNMVLVVETILSPGLLMRELLRIESAFGRKRTVKYGPRTLDMDILFYGNVLVSKDWLKIPHPEIQNRKFALVPLVELVPNMKHPVLGTTMRQLLENCTDTLEVKKVL